MMLSHDRLVTVVAAITLMLLLLGGCAGQSAASSSQHAPLNNGVRLELAIKDETHADLLYRVERDGSISFGGGMKARLDKTTWTGQLSQDEMRELHDLLVQHHWFDRDPVSTNQPRERVYRASVRGAEGSNSFRVIGSNDDVQPIADWLYKICQRRLEPELNKLPEPGLQRPR